MVLDSISASNGNYGLFVTSGEAVVAPRRSRMATRP